MEFDTKPYRDQLKGLNDDRETWMSLWEEIENYFLPGRGVYVTRGDQANKGEKKHSKINDGTALMAMRNLGAGLHGGLTSPARPWFKLKLADEEMEEYGPVRQWLHDVQKMLMNIYSQSNFYNIVHKTYMDLGGFGTACVFQEEDDQRTIRFKLFPNGTYYIDVNALDIVDVQYFHFWQSARQLVEKFGKKNCSNAIQKAYDEKTNEKFQIVHAIVPNENRDITSSRKENLPFQSIYFEWKGEKNQILRKSGFYENPVHCPRWEVTGSEVYGRSPAMDVLGDNKMLQTMAVSRAKGVHKSIDPPMLGDASFKKRININASAMNWVQSKDLDKSFRPLYLTGFDIQSVSYTIEDVRNQIRTGLYTDLFLMLQGMDQSRQGRGDITAREIAERHEEKLLMLGPVIERQFHEFLDPMIDRTFNIALRRGMVPEWPEELEQTNISIEYVSLLAQAQKLVGTQSINALTGFVAGIAGAIPEALDKVDADEAIDQYADMVGVPPAIIRTDDKVKEIRDARAQAIQKQQQAQQIAGMVEGAKTLSQADLESDNALTELKDSLEAV